ncbi:odorant receptor 85f-like [Pogonomyrmex barbatus]|uniref:Odorant receptor n=1 Tax=Pogonomyrmex barbatus TaxID=144034 RepID=A0A6I9WPM0_9HYME|nr:odorant receptor 85f-like [Pogonomyrmex barbatus]
MMKENSFHYLHDVHSESKSYNRIYKEDLRSSMQLNIWVMKIIGTWPLRQSWTETLWNRVLNVICYVLLAFLLIPSGMFIVLEIKDFYNQLKLGSALTFFFMAVMKYCALLLREGDIRRCVDYIEGDWKNVRYTEDRKIMLENANFSRRLVIICGIFMYGGVLFYFVAVPLTRAKIVEEDGNITYRRLVFPVPNVIVDARRSPVNEIFYFIQLFAGFVAHNITVAACGLAALVAMHACGQLQVLMSWISHLVDGREGVNDTTDERLAKIVQLHVRILNFISLAEELLHEISLVEVVGCTLNICFLGYYCMMEWNFKQPVSGLTYLILLISLTFNIFIFCYIGELLTEQTIKIRESSYMIDWYRLPEKKSLAIILIICMSNATTRLTAGNIIELSISSFGDVIKSSVAYLNMLRTFTT